MAIQKRRTTRINLPMVHAPEGFVPSYKQVDELRRFVTAKGKVLPRSRTNLTQKQQRLLAREIKRARHLALLPFVSTLH